MKNEEVTLVLGRGKAKVQFDAGNRYRFFAFYNFATTFLSGCIRTNIFHELRDFLS